MKTPENAEQLYAALKRIMGKKPKPMHTIAVKLGYITVDEKVPSNIGARIRRQLNKLCDEGVVERQGNRATATYSKAPK